jgi:hypothetical protein
VLIGRERVRELAVRAIAFVMPGPARRGVA